MTPRERALLSLDGLSLGDSFGERFFRPPWEREEAGEGLLPEGPWPYTDDTEMALSIVEVLLARGAIDQDELAARFASRMTPTRGYGAGAFGILQGIRQGRSWRSLSQGSMRGMGSFGNGAAMRVAPLGAWFAEEPLARIVDEARRSAEITHAHPEGIAGGIAVAVAAALAWRARQAQGPLGVAWIRAVRDAVPAGFTHDAIAEAEGVPPSAGILAAARQLGNGSGISAPDTVPLCLWVAAFAGDYEQALWSTVTALGDIDTNCAIVGGILALRFGEGALPAAWKARREALPAL